MTEPRATWEQRFLAPSVSFPAWSPQRPDVLSYLSDEDGSLQAWTLDLTSGRRRRVTGQRVGVEHVQPTPDGCGIVWWRDDTGDESGQWVVTQLGDESTHPLLPGVPDGWSQGLAVAPGIAAVGVATEDAYAVWVQGPDSAPARELVTSPWPIGLGRQWETTPGGLSADGRLLCLRRSDGDDILHFALQVVHPTNGEVIEQLADAGFSLHVASWSPVPGDQRVAVVDEFDGVERPTVWQPGVGRRHYPLDLPGPVDVLGWWPDASALLLVHRSGGHDTLHRLDLATGQLSWHHDPDGAITGAAVRPDGEVWFRHESATRPPRIETTDGRVILCASGAGPPAGRPHVRRTVSTPLGPADVLLCTPEGEPPFPTLFSVHGGPEWHESDTFDPWEQACVEHGIAVAKVNYRGSTGSSVAWRTSLHDGNIGFPEVEDVVAATRMLVGDGTADAQRLAIQGGSWGGYVTLLAIGRHPDLFAAAVAIVPVADSVMVHEDCSPPQRAYDRAIMGGSPDQLPQRYAERSPSTYADAVRTPVLIIAGEHDSACPIRQVRSYVERLQARGGDVELVVYDAGHHANAKLDQLHHARTTLRFLTAQLRPPRLVDLGEDGHFW